MSKLDKRAISTLVIALFLLSIFSVAIPVSAQVTAVVVTDSPDPILAGETTTITVTVTAGAADDWNGIITVTEPVAGTWTATISGMGSMAVPKVYPTEFTTGATTEKAGTYTISATANISAQAPVVDTGSFVVEPGAVAVLVFTTQPSSTGYVNDPFTVQPVVEFQDTYGNLVTSTANVALDAVKAIDDSTPGAGFLVGTTSKVAVAGVATFTNVGYTETDTIHIEATSAPLTFYSTTDISLLPKTSEFSIDNVEYEHATYVDYDDVLTVIGSGVTAGSEVNVFWDYASGTYTHLLNTTEGNPDGTFDCEITVPSDVVGNHYLWATDVSTGETVPFDLLPMEPRIKLSPSSGLVGDDITIKGYGFADESEIAFLFNVTALTTAPATVETDELGYFTCTFDIPKAGYDPHHDIKATDEDFNDAVAELKVGTSINLDPEEGPSGTVVTITGRGWTTDETVTLTMGGKTVRTVGVTPITVDTLGKISAKVVIPSMADEDDYDIIADSTTSDDTAKASFEVTGNSAIKLTPGYGPPGGTVEIKGYNFTQIADTEVVIDFGGETTYVTYETDSKGEFIETIRIPAIDYDIHTITARETVHELSVEKEFRIGIMIIILNPSYGPTGTLVSLTGIGFTEDGTWNATMDGVAITDEAVDIGVVETISESIYIPTIPVGTYEVTVLDIETEIDLYEMFFVTATTEAFADPASAPNTYRVLFKGSYFAQKAGADLEFILYNSTETWDISSDVYVYDPDGTTYAEKYTSVSAVLDSDGNFTAWWEVEIEDVLSLGCYTVNVTDDEDLFAQIKFCVCEERIYITPRKTKFDRGDTVQFDVKNDFPYDGSYMKIYDPVDNLYWVTQTYDEVDDEWLKVAALYTVPYYAQTSGGNPMTLSPDAPMGEWFWAFYTDADKQLVNGTFEVGKSAQAILSEQLGKLSGDMTALTDQIDDVTDNIDDLSGEIGDVITDVEGMIDDITTEIAEELAQVAEDTADAISAFEDEMTDSIGDIAEAQNELASDLEESKQTSIDAKEAAEAAQDSTQGLTTIVYGAIACSLIAALAAVVSLMQISKKIA